MARAVAVTVSMEVLSVERGLWCDTCALSTRATVHFAMTTGGRTTLGSKTTCEEHGDG